MRSIAKPIDNSEEVFRTCISRMRESDLKKRLSHCIKTVTNDSIDYDKLGINNSFFQIQPSSMINKSVTSLEMVQVYEDKFVPLKSPGRKYYDKLLSLPKHGICPICGQRSVSTLDHYLPKMKYPSLVVSPINLIPVCKDCNHAKSDIIPTSIEQETLHPYYDNIENDRWLYARVNQEIPISITFFVDPPPMWVQSLISRVNNHFVVFKLSRLYSSHAAEELCNIKFGLDLLNRKNGFASIFNFLSEALVSHSQNHINSWQTAMYHALVEDNWFCNGGFRNIS